MSPRPGARANFDVGLVILYDPLRHNVRRIHRLRKGKGRGVWSLRVNPGIANALMSCCKFHGLLESTGLAMQDNIDSIVMFEMALLGFRSTAT